MFVLCFSCVLSRMGRRFKAYCAYNIAQRTLSHIIILFVPPLLSPSGPSSEGGGVPGERCCVVVGRSPILPSLRPVMLNFGDLTRTGVPSRSPPLVDFNYII